MKVPAKVEICGYVSHSSNFFFIPPFSPVYPDPGTGPGLCLPSCMGFLAGVREGPTRPLVKCRIKYNLKGKERRE